MTIDAARKKAASVFKYNASYQNKGRNRFCIISISVNIYEDWEGPENTKMVRKFSGQCFLISAVDYKLSHRKITNLHNDNTILT